MDSLPVVIAICLLVFTCGCLFHEPVSAGDVSAFHARVNASLAQADRLVAEDPENATAWCLRGMYYNDISSRYDNATDRYYRLSNRYDTALESYDRGLALEPENRFCWYAKGRTLRNMNRTAEAAACFEHAEKSGNGPGPDIAILD